MARKRLVRAGQMDEEDPEVVEGLAEPGDPAPLDVPEADSSEGEEDAAE